MKRLLPYVHFISAIITAIFAGIFWVSLPTRDIVSVTLFVYIPFLVSISNIVCAYYLFTYGQIRRMHWSTVSLFFPFTFFVNLLSVFSVQPTIGKSVPFLIMSVLSIVFFYGVTRFNAKRASKIATILLFVIFAYSFYKVFIDVRCNALVEDSDTAACKAQFNLLQELKEWSEESAVGA